VPAGSRLVVVLANVRDPGNAGTVLRTADAAGAGGIIFAGSSVDPYNSKCVRASAGSLFHTSGGDGYPGGRGGAGAAVIAACMVLAADGGATTTLDDLQSAGQLGRADGPGCSVTRPGDCPPMSWTLADEAIAVPIYGRAESLNLAAAAAVCLLRLGARAGAGSALRRPGRKPDGAVTSPEPAAWGAAVSRGAGARV